MKERGCRPTRKENLESQRFWMSRLALASRKATLILVAVGLLSLCLPPLAEAKEEVTWGIQSSCAGCSNVVGKVIEYTYHEVLAPSRKPHP